MSTLPQSPALTTRLMGFAMIVTILAGAAVLFGAYIYGRAAADRAYDQLMRGAVLQITERIFVQNGALQIELPPSAFSLLGLAENDHVFYNVINEKGESLVGYPELTANTNIGVFNYQNARFLDMDIRKLSYGRAFVEENFSGQAEVIIGQTTEARRALAFEITMRAFWVLTLLGLLLMALLLFTIYWSMRPLHALEHELLSRDPLDFSPLKTEMPREMATFSTSMNDFLRRLKRRVDAMQRIIADSTHQIRTPIAALRAQAELPVDFENVNAVRENKTRIQTQARALSRLTEQLLTQALVSHRADTVKMSETDLRKVAIDAERTLRAARLWPDDVIVLELCDEPAVILGDAFSLREAVKNLITNALEHGKPPVLVTVENLAVIISDEGSGFQSDDDVIGFGRGLQIVRDVMQFHNGRLNFTHDGARFSARLDFRGLE